MTVTNCKKCKKKIKTSPSRIKRGGGKYCSRLCKNIARRGIPAHNKGKPMLESQKRLISKTRNERNIGKGINHPMYGTSKYKTKDEKRIAKLAHARKSYQKHSETRKFYYRQLSYKRRKAIGTHTKEQWEKLKKNYNHCCAICGMQEPFTEQRCQILTEDHITPISKDGSNNIENIQPLCKSCNSRKSNRYPQFNNSKELTRNHKRVI